MINEDSVIGVSQKKVSKLYGEEYAKIYSESDQKKNYSQSISFRYINNTLENICKSFPNKITILEFGCGTGRWFQSLANWEKIVGIDLSAPMLSFARKKCTGNIELLEGGVECFENLKEGSFQFIYSIGVLGEHSPFHIDILNQFYKLLSDDGLLLVTIVDAESKPTKKSWRRHIMELIYPFIPSLVQSRLDERWLSNYIPISRALEVIKKSGFAINYINHREEDPKDWVGAHYFLGLVKNGSQFQLGRGMGLVNP